MILEASGALNQTGGQASQSLFQLNSDSWIFFVSRLRSRRVVVSRVFRSAFFSHMNAALTTLKWEQILFLYLLVYVTVRLPAHNACISYLIFSRFIVVLTWLCQEIQKEAKKKKRNEAKWIHVSISVRGNDNSRAQQTSSNHFFTWTAVLRLISLVLVSM